MVPDGVTNIGSGAFAFCVNLTAITVDAQNSFYSSVKGVLFDKTQRTLIQFPGGLGGGYTVPGSVTDVGNSAFQGCTSLTSAVIAFGVSIIGDQAFQGSGLTSVTIPSSVVSIGSLAFADCASLTSVYFAGNAPSADSTVFADDNATVYYLPGTAGWNSTFAGVPALMWNPSSLSQFDYTTNAGTVSITGYTGPGGAVTIPFAINGMVVTSIAQGAFFYCTSLTSVMIPGSVTSIGNYAFLGSGLTNAMIPGSVTSIGVDAFDSCPSLTSVIMADGVSSIGDGAFQNCPSLASVIVPGSVTSIGYYAFAGCPTLASVCFMGNAPSYGPVPFFGENAVTVYYSPGTVGWNSTFAGVPAVEWNPSSLSQFDYMTNAGTMTITGYAGPGGAVTIPFAVNDMPVTRIAQNAFYYCPNMTSVLIPGSVTSIGDDAFEGCSSLTSVTIPGSVTSIGDFAFVGCASLTNVMISNGVKNIGNGAFGECANLARVTIPGSVTTIGYITFQYCSSLTSITIPGSVTNIGYAAFSSCISLTSVYFTGNAPTVGLFVFGVDRSTVYYLPGTTGWSSTFAGIPAAQFQSPYSFAINSDETITINGYTESGGIVNIPASIFGLPVSAIGVGAFYGCPSLANITIPAGVTSIGNSAFQACGRLTSVIIPGSVTNIGDEAFASCSSLTNATIGNGVPSIGDFVFQNCGRLSSMVIPSSVTSIGELAFLGCSSLTSMTVDTQNPILSSVNGVVFDKSETTLVMCPPGLAGSYTIPDSVTNIGAGAFWDCSSLSSVIIPYSVTSIGDHAFWYCTSLTSVTLPNSVTSIGNSAFEVCSSLASVFITGNAPTIGSNVFDYDYNVAVYYLPGTTGWSSAFSVPIPVLWNPVIQTGDRSFGVQSNEFGFNITGTANIPVVIEACTNLANPVWVPLMTNTLVNGLFYFSEPVQKNITGRFYGLGLP
jgi:hypothetical protein